MQAFGGDGSFPVFGEFEDGEFLRLIVEFEGPDEPDDEADSSEE